MQALQYHPEYTMTLQVRKENHTGLDHIAGRTMDYTAGRTTDCTVGRTTDCTVGRTVEVVVHDPSVCVGST
jgi:hypothetical protein